MKGGKDNLLDGWFNLGKYKKIYPDFKMKKIYEQPKLEMGTILEE
jgi:hypothetical protein